MLPWVLSAMLLCLCIALLIKCLLMRKSAAEIGDAFRERLQTKTAGSIRLSSADRQLRRLAVQVDTALSDLQAQRQQFLRGDRELKEAIAGVSHDIRTPMTAICGYLSLIDRTAIPPETAEKLARIDERAGALQTLAEELLQYAAAASAAPLSLQPVNLSGVLEEELLAFQYALESRGIEPHITMPEKAVWCSLDRNAALRVVENLLSNAVKYSRGDLSVCLTEAGELTLRNAADLSLTEVQRIFERFYTVETCARSTGLGLSVAKLLTEKMGGTVSAALEDGDLVLRVRFSPVKE